MAVLNKDQVKFLSTIIDDQIKAGPLEFVDGALAKKGIETIDEMILSKVSEEYHDDIRELVDAAIGGDVEGIIDESADLLAEIGKQFIQGLSDRK